MSNPDIQYARLSHTIFRHTLFQALIIIMVEKFFLKIPRVAGKVERFYINIVEGRLSENDKPFLCLQYILRV
jgi:hypothetical protein